ncbi:MAG: S1/P1 nuclease [Cyclobacteriaceae bacterium]
MKRILLIALAILVVQSAFAWGQTGHRIVGKIAENHLSKKALKHISQILGTESLAEVANYMDFIKSDKQYRHLSPWHYCTIPNGKTYHEAGIPEEGDAIQAIDQFIQELKSKRFSMEDEAFALKCLIHLIGDIHQPLHVGNGIDKGGNDVKVEYFWNSSNLHRVWDSGIIDGQQYAYSEYVDWIDHVEKPKIFEWQNTSILDWANESKSVRAQVYDFPENGKLNYQYNFNNIALVNQRLRQAGIRLAGVLNDIYG